MSLIEKRAKGEEKGGGCVVNLVGWDCCEFGSESKGVESIGRAVNQGYSCRKTP